MVAFAKPSAVETPVADASPIVGETPRLDGAHFSSSRFTSFEGSSPHALPSRPAFGEVPELAPAAAPGDPHAPAELGGHSAAELSELAGGLAVDAGEAGLLMAGLKRIFKYIYG